MRVDGKRVIALSLLALLASATASRADEAVPLPRKHVVSGGIGVTLGGLGGRYIFRWNECGPTVAAGAGLFGYGLEFGFPVHRTQSKPTRELFLHGGVLRVQDLSGGDFPGGDASRWENEEGSHIWVIGVGPRLWPDRYHRVYVAGAGELMLSNEAGKRWSFLLEGGMGF